MRAVFEALLVLFLFFGSENQVLAQAWFASNSQIEHSKAEEMSLEQNSQPSRHSDYQSGASLEQDNGFDWLSLRPMVLLGGNFASCKFNYAGSHPLDGVKLTYRPGFNAGLGVEVGASGHLARWSLLVSAMLQSLRADGKKTGYEQEPNLINDYEWRMWGHSLKIPLLLRYRLSLGKFQPFVQVGGSFGTWLEVDLTQTEVNVRPQGGSESFTESDWTDAQDIRKSEQALIAGVGVARGKFSLEMRYERGNGFLWPSDWKSTTQSWQLLAGVRF